MFVCLSIMVCISVIVCQFLSVCVCLLWCVFYSECIKHRGELGFRKKSRACSYQHMKSFITTRVFVTGFDDNKKKMKNRNWHLSFYLIQSNAPCDSIHVRQHPVPYCFKSIPVYSSSDVPELLDYQYQ